MLTHFDHKAATLLVSTEQPLDTAALTYLMHIVEGRFRPCAEQPPTLFLIGQEEDLQAVTRTLFLMVNETPRKETNGLNFRINPPNGCVVKIRHAVRITNFEKPSPAEAAEKLLHPEAK